MADSARELVEGVLGRDTTRELWSVNYDKVLPISLYAVQLPAVLSAVFYMFRFGQRRGRGNFLKTFGTGTLSEQKRSATIERISEILAGTDKLVDFAGETEKAILGDLLLCFCLENAQHSLGKNEQVQRVAPAHYMASWLDVPQGVSYLRSVPEMIVAMLADQKGESVKAGEDNKKTWFPVGRRYEENTLLRAFSQGVTRREGQEWYSLKSDGFEEKNESVGLDQLLMIRLAEQLGEAPDKMRGKEAGPISNQRPIAEQAARIFSEDIRRFVRSYAEPVPRYALVEMLESCISIGLTTILTSTVELLPRWSETGTVPDRGEQDLAPLFVDCSNGAERSIRTAAEQSMDDYMRRMERFPVLLMVMRLLDYYHKPKSRRENRKIKKENIAIRPYATDWLNLLGDLLHDRHPQARRILERIEEDADRLADKLEKKDDYPEAEAILTNDDSQPNPVRRLAGGLLVLMGSKTVLNSLVFLMDSLLLIGRPNALAAKRRTTRGLSGSTTRRSRDVRSLIFTDPVLDYLVHLHLLRSGNKPGIRVLSFREFLEILRERYGFCVDTAPPGMTISNELLQRNRAILERRLRDLGLLVGVNDAEAMKRLKPRFEPAKEN